MKLAILFICCFLGNENDSFPGFLGAGSSEVNPASIPTSWSESENIAWKVDLRGYGQSTPVVFDGKVFVTSTEGDMKEKFVTACFDLKSGTKVWEHEITNSQQAKNNVYISRAAPTPVVDSKGLYCFFESGDLIAFDLEGKVLWERSFAKEKGLFQNRFGLAGSPVQTKDRIFILADDNGPSFFAALNKSDGKTVWSVERKSRTSWTSPMMFDVNGKPVIVVSSNGAVDGYDPSNGKQLFAFDDVGGNTSSTPIPNNVIKNGFLVGAAPGRTNEYEAQAGKSKAAFQIEEKNGVFDLKRLWIAEKATPSFGSPILYKGHAYWVNRSGVVSCFDAKSGKEVYKERLGDSVWATPVGLGDNVYFFGKSGTTYVIKAGGKFEVVSENRLWKKSGGGSNFGGTTLYGTAIVNDSLIVRSGSTLYCVRK